MRLRQATLLLAAMSLVLVAVLVPLAILVRTSASDRAVNAATFQAQSLAVLAATGSRADLDLTLGLVNSAATARYPLSVFLVDGTTLGTPAGRTPAVELASRGFSFVSKGVGGWDVLVAVQGSPSGAAVVRAFVSDSERTRGVQRAWLILGLLGLAMLALAMIVGDWLTRSLIRPIRELADVSHRLAAGDLDSRAHQTGPVEVRDVAGGLNHLAGRIQDLLRQERESVADLSHQLRTPLTALRLEVESTPGAQALNFHVNALEDAVTRVIEQARNSATPGAPACDAAAVIADRCTFWSALAEDQHRAMKVALAPGPLPVGAAENDLRASLDALLGNVFAHTPEGTPLAVTLTARQRGGARLIVDDDGFGFPSADALRRGHSGAGSTGLGLDIARRTAVSSGGDLRLGRSGSGGARVTVELGPPRDGAGGQPA